MEVKRCLVSINIGRLGLFIYNYCEYRVSKRTGGALDIDFVWFGMLWK